MGGASDGDTAGGASRLRPDMVSRRLLVLNFVREYIGRTRGSPSYGEIAAALGTNRTRVKDAVRSLVADRMLLRTPGPRGLALPDSREDALRVLQALGWHVISDATVLIGPRHDGPRTVTHSTLPALPVLDYVPEDEAADGAADGSGGDGNGGEITVKGESLDTPGDTAHRGPARAGPRPVAPA